MKLTICEICGDVNIYPKYGDPYRKQTGFLFKLKSNGKFSVNMEKDICEDCGHTIFKTYEELMDKHEWRRLHYHKIREE